MYRTFIGVEIVKRERTCNMCGARIKKDKKFLNIQKGSGSNMVNINICRKCLTISLEEIDKIYLAEIRRKSND